MKKSDRIALIALLVAIPLIIGLLIFVLPKSKSGRTYNEYTKVRITEWSLNDSVDAYLIQGESALNMVKKPITFTPDGDGAKVLIIEFLINTDVLARPSKISESAIDVEVPLEEFVLTHPFFSEPERPIGGSNLGTKELLLGQSIGLSRFSAGASYEEVRKQLPGRYRVTVFWAVPKSVADDPQNVEVSFQGIWEMKLEEQ